MQAATQSVNLVLITNNQPETVITRKLVEQLPDFFLEEIDYNSGKLREKLLALRPDAVLWCLPSCNHWQTEFFQKFRMEFPGLPVIFLTDSEQVQLSFELLAAGGQDCLVRGGFSAGQLENAVRNAIHRHTWIIGQMAEKQYIYCPFYPASLSTESQFFSEKGWTQAQEALRESHRKFATLIKNLPGIVYRSEKGQNWQLVFISEGTAELTGFPPETFLKKDLKEKVKWLNIVHPEDKQRVLRVVEEAMASHTSYQVTYRIFTKDLKMKWLWEQGSVVYDPNGIPVAMEGFVQDMTDRIQAEEELQKANQQLATLISNLPGIVFRSLKDDEQPTGWKLDFISEGALALTGYLPQSFYGKTDEKISWATLVNEADSSLVATQVARAVELHQAYQVTYRIRTKKGHERWLWEQGRAIYDEKGSATSLEGFIHDITDRKRAEHQLIASYKERQQLIGIQNKELEARVAERTAALVANQNQLHQQNKALQLTLKQLKAAQLQLVQSEKMASLGQLTAGIAHEINNPVNYIHSSILGLQEIVDDLKIIMKAYQEVNQHNSIEKLKAIENMKKELAFDDLMDGLGTLVSNIKKGTGRTAEIVKGLRSFSRIDDQQFHPTNLHESIDTTLLLLSNEYKNRIRIEKKYGNISYIKGHPGKLGQVFMNLISNAIQAIEHEGTISIATRMKKENIVEIKISDTGKGIPEDVLPRIFDPFFTTKDVGKGLGLGLSVTYQIVQMHHGNIIAKSIPDVGTSFTILLPVAPQGGKLSFLNIED